jgi:LPS-assembly lipoprotein
MRRSHDLVCFRENLNRYLIFLFINLVFNQAMSGSKMLRPRHSITIAAVVFLIQACGFQLRGALDLSQDISPVYLQQNSAFELGREIRSLLTANKIQMTENVKQAKTQLTLLIEARSRRVLSVDGNGRVKEYLLNYTVNFSIKIDQQKGIDDIDNKSKVDSITVTRSLVFDPDAVVAVVNESEILYKDMQHDVARMILLKLQASSRQQVHDKTVYPDVIIDPGNDKIE